MKRNYSDNTSGKCKIVFNPTPFSNITKPKMFFQDNKFIRKRAQGNAPRAAATPK